MTDSKKINTKEYYALLADEKRKRKREDTTSDEEPKPKTSFRVKRKKFFLTYSRCDLTPEEIYQGLMKIKPLKKYIIAQEHHKDGGTHIHAFFEFENVLDTKNTRWADIGGFHPNDAGTVKNDNAIRKYCTKEENFITDYYQINPYELVRDAVSREKALEILWERVPKDMYLAGERIEWTLARQFKKTVSPRDPLHEVPLYTWETTILDMLEKEPSARQIIWIWSTKTGQGKSFFRKHCKAKYGSKMLIGATNIRDTIHHYTDQRIVWFDIPREAPIDANMCAQLEAFADGGTMMSTKYNGGEKEVYCHVVVSCNQAPLEDRLPNRCIEFNLEK